jgi:hypothetical protein
MGMREELGWPYLFIRMQAQVKGETWCCMVDQLGLKEVYGLLERFNGGEAPTFMYYFEWV